MANDLRFWQPTDATINMDIEGLIGTKLVIDTGDNRKYVSVVGGIDPYIGVSMVEADNPKSLVRCLHGPFDPQFRERYLTNEEFQENYHTDFECYVNAIREAKKTGKLSTPKLNRALAKARGVSEIFSGGGMDCPFGV